MATFATITLTGDSGASYPFVVFPLGLPLSTASGIYAVLRIGQDHRLWSRRSLLCRQMPDDGFEWTVLYIGQTENLKARFENIFLDTGLARINATHLAILGANADCQRSAIEFDLVRHYARLLTKPTPVGRQYLVESVTIAHRSA